jgi:hypothetical protein
MSELIVTDQGQKYLTVQWIQIAFGLEMRQGGSSRNGTIIREYLELHKDGRNILKIGIRWCLLLNEESAHHVNAIRERLIASGEL